MNYFHDMVDNIHQKCIWRPWNQCGSICLDLRRHIWNCAFTSEASRHRDTKELPLEQRPNLHQASDPIEKHTDLLKHGYIIVVKNLSFSLERTVYIWNSACKQLVATGSRWRRSGADRLHTPSLPQKSGTRIFVTGGDCDTCHHDNAVTWQRRMRLLSIQTLNCLSWA